jgi:sugar phosphate isomerase/epimerase
MKLSTSTNILLQRPDGTKASIESSVKACAKAGYKVLDLNFYDCASFQFDFIKENWKSWIWDLKKLSNDLGIEFSQAHSSFYNFCDTDVAEREFWEETVRRSILCAEIMDIPWVVIHAGTAFDAENYRMESLKRNLEYFKGFLDFSASHNVGIAIENLWDLNIRPRRRYTANAEELMELVGMCREFAGPWVGTCWDFEHADIMGQSQRDGLLRLGDTLKAVHVSEQTGMDNDHILPFFGNIDWKEIMGLLRQINYQGDFTYEVHRYMKRIPDDLVDAALKYSIKVGEYILSL